MLIYIESKVFPNKTFVLLVNPLDTIARARAHMLHQLHELGKSDHQFRFRHKGIYLRDAYTFEDYKLLDSSVIKMVPMAKSKNELLLDPIRKVDYSLKDFDDQLKKLKWQKKNGFIDEVQVALLKEIRIFDRRENMIAAFRVLLWTHFLAILLSFTTTYYYSGFWIAGIVLFGFLYCPTYSRLGGYVGTTNVSKEFFLITFFIGMTLNLAASIILGYFLLKDAIAHGCSEYAGDCSYMKLWSIIMYFGHSLFLLATMILIVGMYVNFRLEIGDIIEYYLVQNKDIVKVLNFAKVGSLKEQRNAVFELASLAATGEEAKHKIVQHGGLEVLTNLASCSDETTQEYATESLAELLTVPSIQDQFIEIGGAQTLCGLLHSRSERLMNEAIMAISYIVADSENNKSAIIDENGFYDLSCAAKRASTQAGQYVAGIYLELSFTPGIRTMLACDSNSASALIHLCKSSDDETKRLALQTLELLAIENCEFVITRDELLDLLINICKSSDDDQICLLAGKIFLYYAETPKTCSVLLCADGLKESLLQLAYSPDPVLQNVVAKIVLAIIENAENSQDVLKYGIFEVLAYLQENCLDRDVWDIAQKALDKLHGFTMKMKLDKQREAPDGKEGKESPKEDSPRGKEPASGKVSTSGKDSSSGKDSPYDTSSLPEKRKGLFKRSSTQSSLAKKGGGTNSVSSKSNDGYDDNE